MQTHKRPTKRQVSDTMLLTAFLAFSGGFQDAYTYIVRNHVFANAQTGNIVLMSTKFLAGDFSGGIRYLFPLFAFAGGIFAAEQFEGKFKQSRRLHWRQGILLVEMLLLGRAYSLSKCCFSALSALSARNGISRPICWSPLPVPCRSRPSAR